MSKKYLAGPGGVAQGELTVPGDKSISHRSLMLGGIAEGVTDITGFLAGEDCLSTLRSLQAELSRSTFRPRTHFSLTMVDRTTSQGTRLLPS